MTLHRSTKSGGLPRRAFFYLPLLALPRFAWAVLEQLTFATLYQSIGVLGVKYSDRALALKGKQVQMRGFMAPPIKPESNFFVLTREPVSVCPFCASDAEWPVDIVVIYLKGTLAPVNFAQRIEVEGRLEMGSWTDPHTGFVSQVRLVNAEVHKQ
ncbi:MAG: hypothetical protein P4L87_00580 [Formivibrio sp.]|nr:hypothetical protein [Formivibrio sp.]